MHPPAPKEEEKIPEAVRNKRLKQFRQQLYENSLDKNGRVRLSEASDIPDHNQDACPHEMNHLRWGANSSAHWATCKKCGLKKVLYYSMEHGALVADPEVWIIKEIKCGSAAQAWSMAIGRDLHMDVHAHEAGM